MDIRESQSLDDLLYSSVRLSYERIARGVRPGCRQNRYAARMLLCYVCNRLRADEIVPVQHKKFITHDVFHLIYRVCGTKLLFLLHIFDMHTKIHTITKIIHDALFFKPNNHDNVRIATLMKRANHILNHRLVCDRKHHLRSCERQWSAPSPFARSKNNRLHRFSPMHSFLGLHL
uniref:Uncharacterized protein n=1 Tax=Candidatus Methanogaster sp. ANME-2c ERB4 TaxID=2759911 RepID=A0A7G9YJW4_9EURY|nr:hypothetical protein DHHKMHHO_00002 [Methanosarcinales archaeon ANME-2c ERB4]